MYVFTCVLFVAVLFFQMRTTAWHRIAQHSAAQLGCFVLVLGGELSAFFNKRHSHVDRISNALQFCELRCDSNADWTHDY